MKRWGSILLFLVGVSIIFSTVFFLVSSPKRIVVQHTQKMSPSVSPPQQTGMSQSIFVPYWGIDSHLRTTSYDKYIYFGVTPDDNGINTTDIGYKDIQHFLQNIPSNVTTLLTVTMIDSTINEKVLSDKSLQQKVINDAIHIAKANGFSGVVLDLEYSALAFDSVVKNVSDFSTNFAITVKQNNLLFYQTLAGDTFYRAKPYDVTTLGKNADGIFVMAYDFHKANGDPGPNFPLVKNTDDYDFEDMTEDFIHKVPIQKLTIVFGLFGYDWTVDNKGNSAAAGQSISLKDIEQKFLDSCALLNCNTKRDTKSSETEISYTDSSGQQHIVWFEDLTSVATKKVYLKKQGISSTALWAYSYF